VPTIALPLHPQGQFDYRWSDLQASTPIRDNPTGRLDQLATIIYTSGTTGTPKGVMHNFANFAFAAENGQRLFSTNEADRLISYLPLCHVAERVFVELSSLYGGMTVFFAESLDTFLADLRLAGPAFPACKPGCTIQKEGDGRGRRAASRGSSIEVSHVHPSSRSAPASGRDRSGRLRRLQRLRARAEREPGSRLLRSHRHERCGAPRDHGG